MRSVRPPHGGGGGLASPPFSRGRPKWSHAGLACTPLLQSVRSSSTRACSSAPGPLRCSGVPILSPGCGQGPRSVDGKWRINPTMAKDGGARIAWVPRQRLRLPPSRRVLGMILRVRLRYLSAVMLKPEHSVTSSWPVVAGGKTARSMVYGTAWSKRSVRA